jgi:hypothetical protein
VAHKRLADSLTVQKPPLPDGASETARRLIRDGNRAAEVIARLRCSGHARRRAGVADAAAAGIGEAAPMAAWRASAIKPAITSASSSSSR